MARWLVDRFGLGAEGAKARWLVDRFGLAVARENVAVVDQRLAAKGDDTSLGSG